MKNDFIFRLKTKETARQMAFKSLMIREDIPIKLL